jgi:hypothetical protein
MSNTLQIFDCIKIKSYSLTLYSKHVQCNDPQFPYSPPKCPPFPNAKSERTLIV